MQRPPDITKLEEKIFSSAEALLYAALPDPMDKFIMAFRFHLGYSQVDTCVAASLHKKNVWERTKKIKRLLDTRELSRRAERILEKNQEMIESS